MTFTVPALCSQRPNLVNSAHSSRTRASLRLRAGGLLTASLLSLLPLSVSPVTIACTPHVPLASAHRVDWPFHDKLTIGDAACTAGNSAFPFRSFVSRELSAEVR